MKVELEGGEQVPQQERRKMHDPFVIKLHKEADAPRRRAEERAKNPVFFGKPSDTKRESSIRFWKLWH